MPAPARGNADIVARMSTPPPGPNPDDPYQQGYPPPPGYPPPGYPAYSGPPSDPLVPADIGGWFERIIAVVRRSFVPLLVIQAVVAALTALYGVLTAGLAPMVPVAPGAATMPDLGGLFLAIFLGALVLAAVSLFAQGASVYVAIRDASGEPVTAPDALRFAAGRALPLLGWSLLAGLMLAAGAILLLLPAIYLAIVFGAALLGVVLVERGGIGRCFALVHRRFWPTTGRMLLAFLITFVYVLVLGAVVGFTLGNSALAPVLQSVLAIPLGLAWVGIAVVTYAELRFHERPDVLTPALAAELRR